MRVKVTEFVRGFTQLSSTAKALCSPRSATATCRCRPAHRRAAPLCLRRCSGFSASTLRAFERKKNRVEWRSSRVTSVLRSAEVSGARCCARACLCARIATRAGLLGACDPQTSNTANRQTHDLGVCDIKTRQPRIELRSSGGARVARPVSVTAFKKIYLIDWPPYGPP